MSTHQLEGKTLRINVNIDVRGDKDLEKSLTKENLNSFGKFFIDKISAAGTVKVAHALYFDPVWLKDFKNTFTSLLPKDYFLDVKSNFDQKDLVLTHDITIDFNRRTNHVAV